MGERRGDATSIALQRFDSGHRCGKARVPIAANRDPVHPGFVEYVAAKCGVFAETDIVNLVKSGIPSEEIMNSLADAIVHQNLSVLTRGNTLRHNVLLLGGPNTYLPFLVECWRMRIPETWDSRGHASRVSLTKCTFSGKRERRLYFGLCSAISRSSRTSASSGVAHSMPVTDVARPTIPPIRERVSDDVK